MKFSIYEVEFTLTEPVLGTVPKDPEVYKNFIATKAPEPTLGEKEAETVPGQDLEKAEKAGWTGFHHDENGYFLYDYAILGFLKEAGNVLKEQLEITSLRSKIDQYVFIEPRRVYLAKEVSGTLERPLRCMTMQGPRVTVVRSDYIKEGTVFTIRLKILENTVSKRASNKSKRAIDGEVIRELLEYGQFKGLGQFRNGSYGRFTFKIKEVDPDQAKTG